MLKSEYVIGGHSYSADGIAPTAIECQALCSVLAARMPYILHALSSEERSDVAAKLTDVTHAFAVAEAARDVALPVATLPMSDVPLAPRHAKEMQRETRRRAAKNLNEEAAKAASEVLRRAK